MLSFALHDPTFMITNSIDNVIPPTRNFAGTCRCFSNVHLLLLLVVLNVFGCNRPGEDPTLELRDNTPIQVNTIRLSRTEDPVETVAYYGTLEPKRSRTMVFQVGGDLVFASKIGVSVKQGDIVARLDGSEIDAKVRDLESKVASAEESSRNELADQLDELRKTQNQFSIEAPFDCVVSRSFVAEGDSIRPQSPILNLLESTELQIKVDLPSRIAKLISPEQEFVFVVNSDSVQGKLDRRSPIENSTGTVTLWFEVIGDLSLDRYTFGQTVEARFNLPVNDSGFWVPRSALTQSGNGLWSVMKVQPDTGGTQGEVQRQLIQIKMVNDQFVLIDGQLESGDQLIRDGLHRIVPGQQVIPNLVPLESDSSG